MWTASGRITAWHATDIWLRGDSTAGLVAQVHELDAALDHSILKGSELKAQGVRMVQRR